MGLFRCRAGFTGSIESWQNWKGDTQCRTRNGHNHKVVLGVFWHFRNTVWGPKNVLPRINAIGSVSSFAPASRLLRKHGSRYPLLRAPDASRETPSGFLLFLWHGVGPYECFTVNKCNRGPGPPPQRPTLTTALITINDRWCRMAARILGEAFHNLTLRVVTDLSWGHLWPGCLRLYVTPFGP
jgi:hypothetical protein